MYTHTPAHLLPTLFSPPTLVLEPVCCCIWEGEAFFVQVLEIGYLNFHLKVAAAVETIKGCVLIPDFSHFFSLYDMFIGLEG